MKQDTKWKIGAALFWLGVIALILIINGLYGCTRTIESGVDIVTGKVIPDTLVGPPLSPFTLTPEEILEKSRMTWPMVVQYERLVTPANIIGPVRSFHWDEFDLIAFASAGIYAQTKSMTNEWLDLRYPSNAGVMETLVYGRFFPGRDWAYHTQFYFFNLTDWTIYAVAREDSATSARMAWTDYKTIPWGL